MTVADYSQSFSTIHQFFPGNTFLNFESLRILSTAPYGGCDAAEFLTAVAAINPNDPETWATAWGHAASQAEAYAEEALARGDAIGARDAFLRASSYTRASGYLRINGPTLETHDPRALPTARKVQSLFRRALPLFDCSVKVVSIPYLAEPPEAGKCMNKIPLPGYLYLPAPQDRHHDGKIPVLINVGGADSVQEELYYIHPQGGHQRGYAVLTFEGPGQGIVLREHGLLMRPDWEAVIFEVLNWLEVYAQQLQHEEGIILDLDRIAVAGASMGGYFALRAASDERIKACVAIDPFYDMWDFGTRHVSRLLMGAWAGGWLSDSTIDRLVGLGATRNFQLRWDVSVASSFFGIASPSQILREMKRYSLLDGFLRDRVKSPVFVSGAEKSLYFDTGEHTMKIYEDLAHLGEKRKLWVPKTPEEGGLQAKVGAWGVCNAKVFGWLDEVFGVKRVIDAV